MASTSGYPAIFTPVVAFALFTEDAAVSHLDHCITDIDWFIRFENKKLRHGLKGIRRKRYLTLVYDLEQQVQRRLEDKNAELQTVNRRNADLEEKVKTMVAEEFWYNVANRNETMAANLSSALSRNAPTMRRRRRW